MTSSTCTYNRELKRPTDNPRELLNQIEKRLEDAEIFLGGSLESVGSTGPSASPGTAVLEDEVDFLLPAFAFVSVHDLSSRSRSNSVR